MSNNTTATTPPPIAGGPVTISLRVFQDDSRQWVFRITAWFGDVEVMHTQPHRTQESKRGYATRAMALRVALRTVADWKVR